MSLNRELCEGCPLDGVYEPIEARGPDDARYLIVTDVPSMAAAREDRLLTKAQITLLGNRLEGAGFDKAEFRFTPSCHCAYNPDAHVNKVKTAAHKHCRQHLLREVETHDLEAVIPLGALAASQSFGRATKITKVRGLASHSEELGLPIFPLMSPSIVVMYPQNEPIFNADIRSFARSVKADHDVAVATGEQLGEYERVYDLQFLLDMDPEVVAFDTENTGLRWYQRGTDVRNYRPSVHKGKTFFQPRMQILTMQFTVESGKGYMLVWDHPEDPIPEQDKPRLRNQLRQLLCKPERLVVGQGAKYDNVILWMTEGIRFRIGGDTLMLATLFDENMTEKNLDTLTKVHVASMGGYADWFNATYNKSRMWEVPLKDILGYGVGDADATYRLYHVLESRIMEDEKLWAHYCRATIPGLNAFAAMETRGMFIDEGTALAEFKAMMIADVARMERELLQAIPRDCKQGIVSDYLNKTNDKGQLVNKNKTPADALSFGRPDFLKQVLFTHPKGFRLKPKVFTKTTGKLLDESLREPSVSAKDHLPYFFDECPFTMQLAEFSKDAHLLNTNVIKFEENYIRGGKVRPTYHLHKAVTGRSSCVKGDTPVVTRRGTIPACDIVVGDEVWTHKERWMPVLRLYLKPVTQMYRLTFTDGQTITATGAHKLLLDSGEWVEINFIIRGDHEYQQTGYGGCASLRGSGAGVPDEANHGEGSRTGVRSEPGNRERDDSPADIGQGLRYAESDTLQAEQAGREKPAVRQLQSIRLRGCGRLPDTAGRGPEVSGTADRHVGASGHTPIEVSGNDGGTPHRREQTEQCPEQPSDDHPRRACANTRTVPVTGGGLGIEKIEPAGVHRVYDFEVAQDHSYFACGVFSHNSDDPNGQNFPKRGQRAKAYRNMFVAPPGHYVIELDLSQAEVRIAACMARDRTLIDIYQRGEDVHRATALIVSQKTEAQFSSLTKKEQKEYRQKAKACIAEGQLVLTRDRGPIAIEKILITDLVWDGVEWATHEGVIYQGYKEVITYEGLTATPDHRVYTRGHSDTVQFGDIASQVSGRRIAVGAIGEAPVRYSSADGANYDRGAVEEVRGSNLQEVRGASEHSRGQPEGREDRQLQMPACTEARRVCDESSDTRKTVGREVRCDTPALQQPELQSIPGLRNERHTVLVSVQSALHSVHDGRVPSVFLRGAGNRPQEQRGALRAWECTTHHESRECTQSQELTTDQLRGESNKCYGLVDEYSCGPPNVPLQQELDLPHVPRVPNDGGADNCTRYAHVYDIVNAGPRHRFTVSNYVVSNCVFGFLYGMGWRKFIGYAKTQYQSVFTEDEAKRIRKAFFSKYRSLAPWHEAMRSFAQQNKFVRSFSGRVRHLPMIDSPEEYIQQEAGRQAINSPVQEFGSTLGVMALGRANEEINPQYLEIIGFIHDAIVAYVPCQYLDWGMKTLKRYMQTNPLHEWFGVDLQVPIIADAGFGLHLGEIHECEGFSLTEPFDFTSLVDKEGNLLIEAPRQRTPPNNGMLTRSPYTLPEDLESETAPVIPLRRRLVTATVSQSVEKRITRSTKQMTINRRNQAKKTEETRAIRAGHMVRRTRPT